MNSAAIHFLKSGAPTGMMISIGDDLVVRLGEAKVALSPRSSLRLAEELARKSFRRALDEEALKRRRRGSSDNCNGPVN